MAKGGSAKKPLLLSKILANPLLAEAGPPYYPVFWHFSGRLRKLIYLNLTKLRFLKPGFYIAS